MTPRPLRLLLALLLASLAGCASTAREASRGGAEGAIEGLRADPTIAKLYEDVGRDPTLGGVASRFTAGVVTAVASALVPRLEEATERLAERIALVVRRNAAAADPLAAVDRVVRALARDAEARASAIFEAALARLRAAAPPPDEVRASVLRGAEDLGAALARGAMREINAALESEIARGVEIAFARASSVTFSAQALDRFHGEVEAISMHMSRGTYKEIQHQVQSDDTWKWGLAIGAGVLGVILILRAYREIGRLRVLAEDAERVAHARFPPGERGPPAPPS